MQAADTKEETVCLKATLSLRKHVTTDDSETPGSCWGDGTQRVPRQTDQDQAPH